jgi:hypothetical protein
VSAYFFELTNLQENSLNGNTLRVNPILGIGLRPKFLDHTESEKLKHVGKQTINQSDKLTNISNKQDFCLSQVFRFKTEDLCTGRYVHEGLWQDSIKKSWQILFD